MSILLQLNKTNTTCPLPLLWSSSVINTQLPALCVCIIALITHSVFWLQFIIYSSIRKRSLQWLYAYMITDILLLFRFFFAFIIHSTSNECIVSGVWYLFVCYFEATIDNYLNMTEAYILLALNFCRYAQIAHNKNVYVTNIKLLTFTHLSIYFVPLISFIIQISFGWAQVNQYDNESCDILYTNVYAQIFNIIVTFVLPISLNILVIYTSIRYVHLTSQLRRAQHHVSARGKYNRALVIQFFIFYTVWLLLWSPNLIVFQLKGADDSLMIMQLLNYVEISLDPFIIAALDTRFQHTWYQTSLYLKRRCHIKLNHNLRQIAPQTINATVQVQKRVCETTV